MGLEYLLVKWVDAQSSDGPYHLRRFQNLKPSPIWSIGFGFVEEDRVVLAQDLMPLELGEDPGDELFRHMKTIPRGYIQEIICLAPKESKESDG